ncbi:MAG: DMT family transporter [Azovibrio sp.]
MPETILKRLCNPYLLLTLTALFWAGNMVTGRGLRADVPPIALAFWRWVIAFMFILPFAWPHWKNQAALLKQGWFPILVLGVLGIAGYNTMAYIALQETTATNALLLNSFIPIATIILARLFFKTSLGRLQGLGVLVSLLGVLTIVSRGDLNALTSLSLNQGDIWMVCAVLLWAIYTLGLRFRPPGVSSMLLMAALVGVGLLTLAPFYLWELSMGHRINLNSGSFMGMAYVGIFPSFIGYVLYNRGVSEVGPGPASLFIHLMPVFGTLLAAIFLDERPSSYHLIGIGLIFTGILLVTRFTLNRNTQKQTT